METIDIAFRFEFFCLHFFYFIFRCKDIQFFELFNTISCKKLILPHHNHPEPDLLHVLHLKIHPHQINDNP